LRVTRRQVRLRHACPVPMRRSRRHARSEHHRHGAPAGKTAGRAREKGPQQAPRPDRG
jgi:hypothetical protein